MCESRLDIDHQFPVSASIIETVPVAETGIEIGSKSDTGIVSDGISSLSSFCPSTTTSTSTSTSSPYSSIPSTPRSRISSRSNSSFSTPEIPRLIITPSTPQLNYDFSSSSSDSDITPPPTNRLRSSFTYSSRPKHVGHRRTGSKCLSRRQNLLEALTSSDLISTSTTTPMIRNFNDYYLGNNHEYYSEKQYLTPPPSCPTQQTKFYKYSLRQHNGNRRNKRSGRIPILPLIFILFAFILVITSATLPPLTVARYLGILQVSNDDPFELDVNHLSNEYSTENVSNSEISSNVNHMSWEELDDGMIFNPFIAMSPSRLKLKLALALNLHRRPFDFDYDFKNLWASSAVNKLAHKIMESPSTSTSTTENDLEGEGDLVIADVMESIDIPQEPTPTH